MESRYCEVCEKEVDKWKIHRKRQSHRKKNKMYAPEKIELMDEKEIHRVSSSQQGESYVLNKNDRYLRENGLEMEADIYVEVEREIRKEYVRKFGEESLENYYRCFTRDEQIERYAENLIFWLERMDKIDLEDFGSKDFAKSHIASNATSSLITKMESTLPSDMIKDIIGKIWTKTPELIGKSLVLPLLAHKYGIFKSN